MELYFKEDQIITVDLHEMRVLEAQEWLKFKINTAAPEIKEIVVVHGYSHGTALRNMVRNKFNHPRVLRKVIGLNQGATSLILK